jgi:glutamate dehydrogenase/leucine dehydrogenase
MEQTFSNLSPNVLIQVSTARQVQCAALEVSASAAPQTDNYRQRQPQDVRVLVVGATGYIGKFVVKELIKRGYNVVAFSREKSGIGGKQGMDDVRKVRSREGGGSGAGN